MSGGPIDRARAARAVAPPSTRDGERVCYANTTATTQCGRSPRRGQRTTNRDDVVCADCVAAWNADHPENPWPGHKR